MIQIVRNSHSVALRATNARRHCALKVSNSGLGSIDHLATIGEVFSILHDRLTDNFLKLGDTQTKN